MYGRLAGRRLPFLYKAPEEGLKVSALCGGRNGLYLEESICGIPCLMLVDTGANFTLVRTDLVQKLKGNFIYMAPNISLKTATGEKAEIHGKLDAAIECGSRKFQHKIYIADITDPCILGLDFLQKFNFMVDLEKNEIRTGGEEIPLFSASAEDSKLCSVLAKEKSIIPARSECKLMYGRLTGRRLPFLNKAAEEGLKVSALCGGRNGLYLEGSICGIPCLMLVDTGANVTLVRTDLAQKLKGNFIYTAPNISLKTASGEKPEIHGKLDAAIECGSRKFQHKIYVADITDPCILGLDFLQKFNFMVDLEKNEIRTGGEEIPLFSASAEDSKLCSVLAKEKTIITARSECLIQRVPEASGKFRYAVTDFPSQVSQKGALVAATLVDLKKGAIPVRVLNLDHKPKTIDKGAVIATCEPVVDIVARPHEFSESLRLPSILENLEGLNEEQ
ncbi:hypothetical protein AVEN_197342-1, partial [Araneus ventricosus]